MKPLHGAIALTVLGLGIWGAGTLFQPEVQVASQVAGAGVSSSVAPVQRNISVGDEDVLDPTTLKTFRGAAVDGALRTNHKGELVVDLQLRYWIDYYLSARGEVPLEDILAAMHAEMEKLPQPGQSQAIDLLEDYIGYLAALGEYDEETQKRISGGDLDSLSARLDWQERLRREWMQPHVVDAFFTADESIDRYTLNRIRLQQQGADEATLAAAEAELPEEIRQLRERAERVATMNKTESQMLSEGASKAEVQAWRVQEFGHEAAERLAQADARRDEWHSRLQAYQNYEKSLADKGLGESDRQRLLETYQQRNFSAAEIKRLPAALSLLASE